MKEEGRMNFQDFSLAEPVLKTLTEVGYEVPTPIQEQTIPLVLAGRDVVGQAQTGTGKTAAFALPLLSRIELDRREVQVLVLTPTRELAIQVAEAFQRYATHLRGFHVLPIYGGQAYDGQLRSLRRGVHVVVGTPGRVMDHMRRKTLVLGKLSCLVLDEADEMLRMGFIDDVDWILQQTPDERQTALFSATMPEPIRRIAARHLRNPEHIAIEERATVADTIHQRYWMVSGRDHKLDALTRILEAEAFDGVLIFVRTRTMTVELAEKLEARGYASAGLSGDMPQRRREQTVEKLKKGGLDLLVATDVAARGLDIDRISHVINFDIPHDAGAYIHRIGRTGRAGRSGKAILFVAPRERRLLYAIERATRQKIPLLELPTTEMINDQRIARFKQALTDVLSSEDLGIFRMVLEQYQQEHNIAAVEMAAGLARLVQGDEPLLLAADVDHGRRGSRRNQPPRMASRRADSPSDEPPRAKLPRAEPRPSEPRPSEPRPSEPRPSEPRPSEPRPSEPRPSEPPRSEPRPSEPPRSEPRPSQPPRRESRPSEPRPSQPPRREPRPSEPQHSQPPRREPRPSQPPRSEDRQREESQRPASKVMEPEQSARHGGDDSPSRPSSEPGKGMERFRVEVGRSHGIDPGDLFGAMAYEAALMGAHIDRVDIFDDYSTIDFPRGMRQELFDALKKVRVGGQRLRLSSPEGDKKRGGKDKKRDGKKGSKADETKPKRKKDRHRNRKKRGK